MTNSLFVDVSKTKKGRGIYRTASAPVQPTAQAALLVVVVRCWIEVHYARIKFGCCSGASLSVRVAMEPSLMDSING